MKQIFRQFALAATCLFIASAVMAQVTTSSMSGRITDSKETLPGATVKVTHVPSGTVYVVTTNNDGRYAIQGMRTGGPYKVEIHYIGFSEHVTNDIFLQLGETYVLNAQLKESQTTLTEVVVSGIRATKFTTEKTGASTNVNNQQMQLIPTVSRSLSDMARLSPYANGMSFAGGDGRSANLTLDGANLNNNFGLSSALPGGGNPISLDAIEEIQVVIAPFDVRQTNFIGGGVNAITKSGTNTIKGTAYIYHNNQSLHGSRVNGVEQSRPSNAKTIYGATLGAPIIKNKLFFFGSVEYEKSPQEVITWRASTNGVADRTQQISRVSESDLQKVSDHLKSKYGYETGSYKNFPADESNLRYLLRLDWNISNAHKLSIRYNHTKNMAWNPPNGNSADVNTRSTMMRVSEHSMSFANSMYSMDNIVNTVAGELNSRFSNKISNQLVATYSLIKDTRGSTSSDFPFIDILAGDIDDPLNSYIAAGYELFTWNNGVTNKVLTVTDNITFYLNAHKLMAGVSFESQYADNNYMRNATGYYRYASLSDFLNGATPIDFALTYGANGVKTPSNAVEFNQLGFYLQDEWNILNNLKVTLGVRADNLKFVNTIMRNNAIYNLDFGGKKIDTGVWPNSRINWSPRFGFTYDVNNDRSFVIRGGTGLFTGRLPLVFFTNMPSNAGMNQLLMRENSTFSTVGGVTTINVPERLERLRGGIITDIDELIRLFGYQTTVTPESGSLPSSIAGVDPEFKMPQVWKTGLAFDYQIPVQFPFTATIEGTYTKNINALMLDNYALKTSESGSWSKFSGSDNRIIYPASNGFYYNSTVRDAAVLTNTDKGYGYTFNVTLHAQPARNLNMMAAYTYTEMREVSGMPGSNASSAWSGLHTVNGPNLNDVQRSQYVIPHNIIGSISYRLPDLGYKSTTISLFYRGIQPYGNSFMYTNDMNGDGISNDLIYIPSKRGDINFTTQADEDAFFAFMEQDKYLSKHKGQYAESYAARPGFTHRFDFRILQDFYVKAGNTRNTLQLSFDFMNVGNLLNSKWGIYQSNSVSNSGRILRYDGKDANNKPSFSMVKVGPADNQTYPTKTYDYYYSFGQCWYMQVGLRYIFN